MAVLAAVNVLRAMTLPVTLGEAWNYDRFIAPGWHDALLKFDINNHVLNTLLSRTSSAHFHLTELSLRLPSLLFGMLYLWVVYRVARRFGSGPVFLMVVALLTLNPMVLDGMSEARGYGMGLALLMWAMELMVEWAEGVSAGKLKSGKLKSGKFNLAAVFLGLSVVASLAFVVPAVALGVVFLAWSNGWGGVNQRQGQGIGFGLAAFLTAFVFLVIPIDHIEPGTFLEGATSLRQTLNSMTISSLGTSLSIVAATVRAGMALLAMAGAVAAGVMWRRRAGGLVVLSGGTLALSLVILLAAHRWVHSRFPEGGSVYLIPLCTLLVTALILKWKHKAVQIAFYVVGVLLIGRYVSEVDFHGYGAGREFAGGRALAKALRADAGTRAVRIGVSEGAEPIVNYYRTRLRQGNWERIERKPLAGIYEYYVLAGADRALVEQRHLHVLYQDTSLTLAQ